MIRAGAGLLLLTGALIASAAAPGTAGRGARTVVAALGPASLSIANCTEVDAGDTFDLEVRVNDVSDLVAWEVYFAYDPAVLEVIGKDVRLFLAQSPNSNVFDFSDPVPNSDGLYRLGAADLGMGKTTESGSGALTRLTLRAKAKGVSPAAIYRRDVNGDTVIDLGPTLTGPSGKHIDDADGNGIFDGPITSGQVAVDRRCVEPPPTPDVEDIIVIAPTVAVTVAPGTTSAPGRETSAPVATQASSPAPMEGTPAPQPTPILVSNGLPGSPPVTEGGGVPSWAVVAAALTGIGGLVGALFLLMRTSQGPA